MSSTIHYKNAAPWNRELLFNSSVGLQPQQESCKYQWNDSTVQYTYIDDTIAKM